MNTSLAKHKVYTYIVKTASQIVAHIIPKKEYLSADYF